jgi:hypothetical protein
LRMVATLTNHGHGTGRSFRALRPDGPLWAHGSRSAIGSHRPRGTGWT